MRLLYTLLLFFSIFSFFFFNDTATTEIYTLSLHDALPICLAEVGYVGTTLAEIARRAGVSPGLVSHYFGEKDGLLEAAFRTLARTLAVRVRARLAQARTPRARVQAVIDTNLAPEEFDQRTGTAWLAFWGQVLHVRGLKRGQTAYQRRMLSNLRRDLRRRMPC